MANGKQNSVPFRHLIGGPLKACIGAQEQASLSTWSYIRDVGLDGGDAVMVSFSFISDGRKAVIRVPLLTIVPVPYLSIDTLDIKFRANVTDIVVHANQSSRESQLIASYTESEASSGSLRSEHIINVAVRARQDHLPSGLAKVMGAMEQSVAPQSVYIQLRDEHLALALKEGAGKEIPKQLTPTFALATGQAKSLPMPLYASGLERAALGELRGLEIQHTLYPLWTIEDLSYLHSLLALRITGLDLARVQTLDLGHVPDLYSLELEGNGRRRQSGQHSPTLDFSWLTKLRTLRLKSWGSGFVPTINLTGATQLRHLSIEHAHHDLVDISNCRELEVLTIVGGHVRELRVWRGFQRARDTHQYDIPSNTRVVEK